MDRSSNLLTRRESINLIDIAYAAAIVFFSAVCCKLFYRMSIEYHGNYSSDLIYYVALPEAENKETYRLIGWVFDLIYRHGFGLKGMAVYLGAVIGCICLVNFVYLKFFTHGSGVHRGVLEVASICVIFIGPMYIPGFHEYFYRWSFSAFAWHSPTEQSMVLFSVPAMICFIKMYESAAEKISVKWWILTMLTVLLSAFSKPAFAIDLILAMIIMFLIDLAADREDPFGKRLLKRIIMGLSLIPSGLYILLEMKLDFAGQGEGHSGAVIVNLDHVINYNNLFAAAICTLAFPLLVGIVNYREFGKRSYKSVLFVFLTGLLQWVLFTEEGERARHGNFAWGRQIATYLLIMTCLSLAIKNWQDKSFMENRPVIRKLYFAVIAVLLTISIISQLYYFYIICMGRSYLC